MSAQKRVKKAPDKPIQQLRIKLRGYDHKVIDACSKQIVETALRYGAEVAGPIPLPTEIKKFTVQRSTFVHKDAREQFEQRTHKRLIMITSPSQQVIEALTHLNLAAGVEIEIKM